MKPVRILVDSTVDLPERCRAQVRAVPLTVHFGDEELIDGVTIDRRRFYERLIESDVLPTTSQATPAAFAKEFEAVRQAGESAVVITISAELSGTYQSACIAAADYEDIYVVDSRSAAIGSGILAELALEWAADGMAAAELAGLLGIKPVVTLENGAVTMIGKARGSKQGNNLLVQKVRESGGIDFSLPILLGYTGLSDALLQKYVADSAALWRDHCGSLEQTLLCSVIGTHTGPGVVAVAFFKNGV
jgi:fatty acid-binding protein DegV